MREKGFTLIEAVMVAGLIAASSLALVSQIQSSLLAQNNVQFRSGSDNLTEEIRAALSDPQACKNSFGGNTVGVGTTLTPANLKDATNHVIYSPGGIYNNNSVRLNAISVTNFVPNLLPLKATMTLHLDLKTQRSSMGAQEVPRDINLNLDLNSAGQIVNCIAYAKMSDGIWQHSTNTPSLDSIFYDPPNAVVGIGVVNPYSKLHVLQDFGGSSEGTLLTLDSANSGQGNGSSVDFRNGGAGFYASIAGLDGGNFNGQLEFRVNTAGAFNGGRLTTNNTKMVINPQGWVGVGTRTPANLLDLNGNANLRGTTYLGGNGANITADGASGFIRSPNGLLIQNLAGTSTTTFLSTKAATSYVNAAGGNFGVGTNNPQAKLDIAGSVKIASDGLGCNSGSEGAMRYNGGTHAMEVCQGNPAKWGVLGGKLQVTEAMGCSVGGGVYTGPCAFSYNGVNAGGKYTTTQTHDFCSVTAVAGWQGGYWGACTVTGSSGSTWTMEVYAYNQGSHHTNATCNMTCIDVR